MKRLRLSLGFTQKDVQKLSGLNTDSLMYSNSLGFFNYYKKFKKMIHTKHFDRDYLELEQKKKSLETEIELALKDTNFERAKVYVEELEELVKLF